MSIETLNETSCFGGRIGFYRHASEANHCDMQFSVFVPPQASAGKVPVVTFLSGLTCTEENFMVKSGAQRVAAELGIMLVSPDTSPRGHDIPDDPDGDYDFGLGAGFYVNATEAPWSTHYHMADYVTEELPGLIADNFPADRPGSAYLAPQVLVDVNHDMRVMTEESFGPVVGIMRVDSDEQAIALMNDSDFGLTASVWTNDADGALAIGERVATGTWFMNRCDYLDPALAWTGINDSGHGCTLSRVGYEQLTRPMSFHLRTEL